MFPTGGMDGHTAMHLAARFGQENCVKTLAKKLPDLVKARGVGKVTTSAMWIISFIVIILITLWLFNIAMENSPFIVYLLKMVIFHDYVK